jgi:ATP-dependent DNA ligase
LFGTGGRDPSEWVVAIVGMPRSGNRTDDWLKIKTSKRQEVVIVGFTAPRRTRPFFGALTLAVREKNGWRYIGHVGTGFSHETLEELHGKLIKLKSGKSPFAAKVKDEAFTTWVKPKLVAEVKFTEWTSSGEMRHPVYLGLRADKQATTSCASAKRRAADRCQKREAYFGACNPGDESHSRIWAAVSACRALRISMSRSIPGGVP